MFSYPLSKHLQDLETNRFFSRPFAVLPLTSLHSPPTACTPPSLPPPHKPIGPALPPQISRSPKVLCNADDLFSDHTNSIQPLSQWVRVIFLIDFIPRCTLCDAGWRLFTGPQLKSTLVMRRREDDWEWETQRTGGCHVETDREESRWHEDGLNVL